jgi:hypothetical protein
MSNRTAVVTVAATLATAGAGLALSGTILSGAFNNPSAQTHYSSKTGVVEVLSQSGNSLSGKCTAEDGLLGNNFPFVATNPKIIATLNRDLQGPRVELSYVREKKVPVCDAIWVTKVVKGEEISIPITRNVNVVTGVVPKPVPPSSQTGVVDFLGQIDGCTFTVGQLGNGFNFVATDPKVIRQLNQDWGGRPVHLQYVRQQNAPWCADGITYDGVPQPAVAPNNNLVIKVSPVTPRRAHHRA